MEITNQYFQDEFEKKADLEPRDVLEAGSTVKIQGSEVKVALIENLEIHKEANIHPMSTRNEYAALRDSIAEIGQTDPVILYRGKVIDGRHRMMALKELGRNEIKTTSIANNTTLKKVKEIILGTEIRRHQTLAQRSIRAYFEYAKLNGQYSQEEIATKHGIPRAEISRAKKVNDFYGTNVLKEIVQNGSTLAGGRTHTTLSGLIKLLKTNKDKEEKTAKEEYRALSSGSNEKFNQLATAFEEIEELGDDILMSMIIKRAHAGLNKIIEEQAFRASIGKTND